MKNKLIGYLDMDGVCCDFLTAAIEANDHNPVEVFSKWIPGDWNVVPYLHGDTELFWENIHFLADEFWSDLEPFEWFDKLREFMYHHFEEWYILSSPSNHDSYVGKIKWLGYYFGPSFKNYVLTSHKHLLAKKNTVLIDDHEGNIDKFRQHGGQGIIFPSHVNSMHEYKNDPMPFVEHSINIIKECL